MEKQIFRCQSCRVKLNIGGLDSLPGAESSQSSSAPRQTQNIAHSTFGGSKVDESFIVLDHNKSKGASGKLFHFLYLAYLGSIFLSCILLLHKLAELVHAVSILCDNLAMYIHGSHTA